MFEKGIAVIGSTTIDKNIYDNKNQLKIGGVPRSLFYMLWSVYVHGFYDVDRLCLLL